MKIIKEDVSYKTPAGMNGKYDIIEHNNIKFSVNKNIELLPERYRPRILDDLVLPDKIYKKVESIIKSQKIPNMLFFSSKGGTGKDSIISVLVTNIPMTLRTINCSLYRGIADIKEQVMSFVKTNSSDGTQKVLYLSETGGMSNIAIDSLKALIEDYSHRVTFLLTTNSVTNISHAFKSRFEFFDMNVIPDTEKKALAMKAYHRLINILEYENIEYQQQDVQHLLLKYFPSYRELMNGLAQNIVDGKFTYSKETSTKQFDEIITYINQSDYENAIKMNVNVENFVSILNEKMFDLLIDTKSVITVVPALDDLNKSLQQNVPFIDISFAHFILKLINGKVKLKTIG